MFEDLASTQTSSEGSPGGDSVDPGQFKKAAQGNPAFDLAKTMFTAIKGGSLSDIANAPLKGSMFQGMFGSKESPADKTKQKIQQELANLGYGQFQKMSGWKGDEKRKQQAMATIFKAVQADENNAGKITGWLDSGGNITPETIRKIKANNLTQKSSGSTMMGLGTSGAGGSGSFNARNLIIVGLVVFGGWYYIENYS